MRRASTAMNVPRPRASTSHCWLRISAMLTCLRPLTWHLARFHAQGPVQRHRLQVVDGHLGSQRHHVPELIDLAHGFVEDDRDDAAVAVSGRAGVAFGQPESTDETAALFVVGEAQLHAAGVARAAAEAVVLLQLYVAGVVSSFVLFASHRKILARAGVGTVSRRTNR